MILKSFWYQFFINTPFAAAARRQRGAFHRLCQWTDSVERASFRMSDSESEKGLFDTGKF